MNQKLFITLEGGEGLGKSTQAAALEDKLRQEGYSVLRTREPGGTALGTKLREVLLHSEDPLSSSTELLLMMADRAQHVHTKIKPALEAGQIVICDRYWDSTMAYQGAGRGWSRLELVRLHAIATGDLLPDLTFVMVGEPHRSLSGDDTFERLGSSFHARVRDYFESLPGTASRYVRVNANQDPMIVTNELYRVVKAKL